MEATMRTRVLPRVYDTASWPGRVLDGLDRAVTTALIVAVAVMVGVVAAQVALRYGFNRSFDWADEVSRLAFVWSIFLAIPLGVRQGAHIGIDVVVLKFPPAVQRLLRRAAAAVSAVLMGAVAWAAVGVAVEQWDEPMSVLDWSVGWFIVPVAIGAALSALHLVRIVVSGPPMHPAGGVE
jgi:TRAP-type C4-dicarboxylate transport system permease small subunit